MVLNLEMLQKLINCFFSPINHFLSHGGEFYFFGSCAKVPMHIILCWAYLIMIGANFSFV
jgi:hypothetical protein